MRGSREDALPPRLDELPFVSERGRFKLRPPSRERVLAARPLKDALRSALPMPGDMLLLRPPALPPAPSGPRHRAHARPLTNTPTYPRKPRRAASAGEGCATAVTPAACATVAPPQCQSRAGQQPIALWCSRSGSGPMCVYQCACRPPTHTRARHARARSSECGHRTCRQGRPDAAETPTGALTCSRVTCAITLACCVLGGGGSCACVVLVLVLGVGVGRGLGLASLAPSAFGSSASG